MGTRTRPHVHVLGNHIQATYRANEKGVGTNLTWRPPTSSFYWASTWRPV